jgi:hypothetical protein
MIYLQTLKNAEIIERLDGKAAADEYRRRADALLDARLSACLDEKIACEKECSQCFGTPKPGVAALAGGSTPEETIRSLLQSIAELLAPYADPNVEIPKALTDEIRRRLAEADAAAGKYPPDYGNAPSYPVLYAAEIVRPSGTLTLRGQTEPFGRYSLFVPRDGQLVGVSFYDPRTRRWGSITPYLRPEAADRLPWFNLDEIPADAADADADGLPDQVEFIYGTDAARPDTDGDGILDGVEVDLGSDPLDGAPAQTGIIATAQTQGPAVDVTGAGELVLVAELEQGVSIFDVLRPAKPVRVAQVDTPGRAERVAATAEYLAVADGAAGLAILVVTNPATARVVHELPLGGAVTTVTAGGAMAFAGTAGGQVVAVELGSGAILSRLPLGKRIEDLALAEDQLYAFTADSLFVLAVNAGELQMRATVASPFVTTPNTRLSVGGGFAYCTHGKGVNTFDVSQPAAPRLIAAANTAQFGWKQTVPNGSGYGLAAVSPVLDLTSPADHNVALYDLHDPPSRTSLSRFSPRRDLPAR